MTQNEIADICNEVASKLSEMTDEGPESEGWKSDYLIDLIARLQRASAAVRARGEV